MWQTIAVICIVVVALIFAARRTIKVISGKASGACAGCNKKGSSCGK